MHGDLDLVFQCLGTFFLTWQTLPPAVNVRCKAIFDLKRLKLNFEYQFYNFSAAEEWQPLLTYRNSLVHGEGEVPIVTSKRPYTRKRKYGGSDDDEDDDDDPEYR